MNKLNYAQFNKLIVLKLLQDKNIKNLLRLMPNKDRKQLIKILKETYINE